MMLNAHLDISRFFPWVQQLSEFKNPSNCNILSSGCGSGGDLFAFMESGAYNATGIEVDFRLAKLAKNRFLHSKYQDRVMVSVYNGTNLPLASNQFDIAFSTHVLEHTMSPEIYLCEIFRVLKSDGILFLDLPNRYYKIEQHTNINFLHYLPVKIRDKYINLLLRNRNLNDDLRYKLSSLINSQIPSADQIHKIIKKFRNQYNLIVEDAFFHSYSQKYIRMRPNPSNYFIGRPRKQSTFRIIIRKT